MNASKEIKLQKSISKRCSKFPFKFEQMLKSAKHQNSICWSQDGGSVVIKNKDDLAQILPLYFKTHRRSSFNRQLNIFGFKHSKNELNQEIIYHPLFTRDFNQLQPMIKQIKITELQQHQQLKHELSLILIQQQKLQQQVVILMQIQTRIQNFYSQIFKVKLYFIRTISNIKQKNILGENLIQKVLLRSCEDLLHLKGSSSNYLKSKRSEILLSHREFLEACFEDPEEEYISLSIQITPHRYFI